MEKIKLIEVLPENVTFLKNEVLAPLTKMEVADLMGVSLYILSKWMREGIPVGDKNLDGYYALEKYIEEHGARSVMEGRIITLSGAEDEDRRCVILEGNRRQFSNKYIRCRYSKAVGMDVCSRHAETMQERGIYLTIDGDLVGAITENYGSGPFPKRCIAYCHGGSRCMYAGILTDGLCRVHLKELQKFGRIPICNDNLAETRYAEKAGRR